MNGLSLNRNGLSASCRQIPSQRPAGGTPPARSGAAARRRSAQPGFMLIECLVYIAVLFVVLGVGYAAVYHCMNESARLRRNADDISRALNAGEIWRADVRATRGELDAESSSTSDLLHLPGANGGVTYRFETNTVFRSVGDGPWTPLLEHVRSSAMRREPRKAVIAWRWEVELQTGTSSQGHTQPLFTFFAVPAKATSQ